MIQVEISPDTRAALLNWAQDVFAEANAPDDTVRKARSVYRSLEAGTRLSITREAANEILQCMWSVKLETAADAVAIRSALYSPPEAAPTLEAMIAENVARENLEEIAERAVGEYREVVAVVIDAVLTLGPANSRDDVQCWAERRLKDAMQMLVESVSEATREGGAA